MKIPLVNGLLMVAFAVAISVSNADNPMPTGIPDHPHNTTVKPSTTEPTSKSTPKPTTTPITSSAPTSTDTPTTESRSSPTTTKSAPVTTVKPAQSGTWNVTGQDGHMCILFDASIHIALNYYSNTTGKMVKDHKIDVPAEAEATGMCGPNNQHLELAFNEDWKLVFYFSRNGAKYNVSEVMLVYSSKGLPDAEKFNEHTEKNKAKQFAMNLNSNYVCKASQTLLTGWGNDTQPGVVKIYTSSLQFEAFGNFTSHKFSESSMHCSADEVSQLVPIIVGAVLAGLIVIVLIAYLIGRRRSRRGYESV